MVAVVRLFWSICLLRRGPEAVPTHIVFLAGVLVAQLVMSAFALRFLSPELRLALTLNMTLIGIVVSGGIAWFALYVRGFEARFPATFGAMLGTGVLLDAALLLAHGATSGIVREGAHWVVLLWSIVVVGFILHRALSCKLWLGGLLSFGMSVAGMVVIQAALGTTIAASLA